MGKKRAKKVKKAWRNISTKDIDDFNDSSMRDAHSGGSLASAPSHSIFVLDKSSDVPVKRKIEKNRERVLRFESILQRNPFIQPIPSSKLKRTKNKLKENAAKVESKDVSVKKEDGNMESNTLDIWSSEGGDNVQGKKPKPSLIPAVEVEPPGCSFNPEAESHKDSLAQAVADEMKKIYRNELEPQPIPLVVSGETITDEERYFLDVDDGEEDEEEENQVVGVDTEAEKRAIKEKRVTRAERNRKMRRKEQIKAEEEAKKAKELSKEIDSIPDILKEIAEEDEVKKNKHIRRMVAKEERLKSCPPRLGKRKFEPAPVQVLLTEEITGSLRKLKACCTLAKDRFKSLEKRGFIPPIAKSGRK